MGFFSSGGLGSRIADPGNLFGLNPSGAEEELRRLSNADFLSSTIQRFLPSALRNDRTGAITDAGIQGIGELIRNPGGLGSNVAAAIRPRLAAESESIGTNFRGLQSQQAGSLERSNAPISLKAALSSALDTQQERAQRESRRGALQDSDRLRREDLQQTFKLLEIINQFITGRLSPSVSAAGAGANAASTQQAGAAGAIGSIFSAFSASRFKEGFEYINEDDILGSVRSLPLYRWSYKGEKTQHIGPMAEDFLEAFRVGDNADKIPIVDAIGTLMAATQALAQKVDRLEGTK